MSMTHGGPRARGRGWSTRVQGGDMGGDER